MEGLRVTYVQAWLGDVLEIWVVTDYPAAACPDCGTVPGQVHETVLARDSSKSRVLFSQVKDL
jgi:hypothetical protein